MLLCVASICSAATGIRKDKGGDRLVVTSAGTLLVETGGTMTIADGSIAAGDIALTTGSVLVGTAGIGAALDASTTTQILIGNGTTITSAALSGDATMDATGAVDVADSFVQNVRERLTIAQINAGADLLPAITGSRYRMISCKAVAYGGAAGSTTSVDVMGDDGSAAVLVSFAQANLTQSTVLKDGGTGATVLADGASYVSNTASVAITVANVGTAIDTATGIDFIISYVVE